MREVTPTHAGVNMGLAALGVLAGSFSTNGFDKEVYKGNSIETMPNPTESWFIPKAKVNIGEWLSKQQSGYVYKRPLYVGRATWSLIYNEVTNADASYKLKYKLVFYKQPETDNPFSSYIVAECAPTPVDAPLAEWQAGGYAKVKMETEKYMNACLLELNNQLPRLLAK